MPAATISAPPAIVHAVRPLAEEDERVERGAHRLDVGDDAGVLHADVVQAVHEEAEAEGGGDEAEQRRHQEVDAGVTGSRRR